jgi:hypothetical protein
MKEFIFTSILTVAVFSIGFFEGFIISKQKACGAKSKITISKEAPPNVFIPEHSWRERFLKI